MPDVPAVSEVVPGYDATTGVYGILVPARTPKAVIDRLEKAIVEVSNNPVFREKLQAEGGDVVGSTAKEYGAYLEVQRDKWGKLFSRLGIKPE